METIGETAPAEMLLRHLRNFISFDASDERALTQTVGVPTRIKGPRRDLIREGEMPRGVILILSGWACRYKMLEDGRRQLVAMLIPGDMCDLHNGVLSRMDHSIGSLTAVRYARLSTESLDRLSPDHPVIGQALWWQMLVNISVQREWTMNIGQRSAMERIGSLLCELSLRLRAIGLSDGTMYDFPLTQSDLAEATGLTPVHVNRTVQHLRAAGLIIWSGKTLTIPDFAKLSEASLFNADYLHLNGGFMRHLGARSAITGG